MWPTSATALTHAVNPSHPLSMCVCVCVCVCESTAAPVTQPINPPLHQLWEKADNAVPCVCVWSLPLHIIWGLEQDRHIYKLSFSTRCFSFFSAVIWSRQREHVKRLDRPFPAVSFSSFFSFLKINLQIQLVAWKSNTHTHTCWFIFFNHQRINIFSPSLSVSPGDLCDEVVDPCLHGFDPCQHDSKCVHAGRSYRWVTASQEVST